jgi:hypothetical protein
MADPDFRTPEPLPTLEEAFAPPSLSPAAQAVLDAAVHCPVFATRKRIAAALRAAAKRSSDLLGDIYHHKYREGVEASADFLEHIATELENIND